MLVATSKIRKVCFVKQDKAIRRPERKYELFFENCRQNIDMRAKNKANMSTRAMSNQAPPILNVALNSPIAMIWAKTLGWSLRTIRKINPIQPSVESRDTSLNGKKLRPISFAINADR